MKGFFLSFSGSPFASSSLVKPICRRPVRDSMIFSRPSNAPPQMNRMSLVLTWMYSCCGRDRESTRLNSSHLVISHAVFCLKQPVPVHHFFPHVPRPHGAEVA